MREDGPRLAEVPLSEQACRAVKPQVPSLKPDALGGWADPASGIQDRGRLDQPANDLLAKA